jgi:hypothetical protein
MRDLEMRDEMDHTYLRVFASRWRYIYDVGEVMLPARRMHALEAGRLRLWCVCVVEIHSFLVAIESSILLLKIVTEMKTIVYLIIEIAEQTPRRRPAPNSPI